MHEDIRKTLEEVRENLRPEVVNELKELEAMQRVLRGPVKSTTPKTPGANHAVKRMAKRRNERKARRKNRKG